MTGTDAISCGKWGGWKVKLLGTVEWCLRHKANFHGFYGKRTRTTRIYMKALNKATELSSTGRILFWFDNKFRIIPFLHSQVLSVHFHAVIMYSVARKRLMIN